MPVEKNKYKQAVSKLENYRVSRMAIENIRNKIKKLLLYSGPVPLKGTSYDGGRSNTPAYHASMSNIADEMQQLYCRLAAKQEEVKLVEDALAIISLGRNCEHYADILIMRHIDGFSMEVIADRLGYSSRRSVYYQYDKAMKKFAIALGV